MNQTFVPTIILLARFLNNGEKMNKNYKKKEIIVIKIARKMISTTIGAHIPTIAEICEEFQSSRGLVQAAIALLEENGAIILEKQRKTGTILQEKDLRKLFEFAEIAVLSGSMALPFTPILSGLATGVFQSLQDPNFHFTFAFMQGAKNRIYALENGNYDFIVVSKA
ncbi:MAG: GntR family transcriptional regulator, partial [Streptococcaceae bacterium]|nr:GntR family transcriptional regulator [Streptococcaceae bacterium]